MTYYQVNKIFMNNKKGHTMKLLLYILLSGFIFSNIQADENFDKVMKRWADSQKAKYEREKAKAKKEWNDPHNKYIRELTKKHYKKDTYGDEEKEALHNNIIDSIKKSN